MKPSDDDLIPTAEAARILGLSVQQVRTHARKNRLRGQLVGRDWVFRRGDVKAFKPAPVGKPPKDKPPPQSERAHTTIPASPATSAASSSASGPSHAQNDSRTRMSPS
jgi:excisionase family DNA binding protein